MPKTTKSVSHIDAIHESVRAVFFQTELDDFQYATSGGTLFIVRFRSRPYAITCKHVLRQFEASALFVARERYAKKGSKPAPVKTLCFPSSPTGGAVDSDVEDLCIIEFEDVLDADWFEGAEYSLDERPFGTSSEGHHVTAFGVLKEKSWIEPPDITFGYCRLDMIDGGSTSDPLLRVARALFFRPDFKTVTGMSGAPVFDQTSGVLCGMVTRGGMTGDYCELRYVDIFDLTRLLESVSAGAGAASYTKSVQLKLK
jgi:hypothetical protein